MVRRLTRLASILGLFLLAYGIVWLAIWNPGAQSDLDSLPLELGSPSQARLMIVGGVLLLLAASITRLMVKVASRKGSVRVPKP